jgi:hypothetical protein
LAQAGGDLAQVERGVCRAELVVGHGPEQRLDLDGCKKRIRRPCCRVAGGRSTSATGLAFAQRRRIEKANRPCMKVRWLVTVFGDRVASLACIYASTWSGSMRSRVRSPKCGTRWRSR